MAIPTHKVSLLKVSMGLTGSKEYFITDAAEQTAQEAAQQALQTLLGGGKIVTATLIEAGDLSDQYIVTFEIKDITSGYVAKDARIVTMDSSGEAAVGPAGSGDKVYSVTVDQVRAYYSKLRAYNDLWNRGGWLNVYTTAILASPTNPLYNPPRPSWNDPIFNKHIGIYNANLRTVGNTGGAFAANTIQSLSNEDYLAGFKKYIAPTPAEPAPPSLNDLQFTPESTAPPLDLGTSDAASQNSDATSANTKSYNTIASPSDSWYDPPLLTDDYETILMKMNAAYDAMAAQSSASIMITGSTPSQYDRRLRGRMAGIEFPIPRANIPAGDPPSIKATRYGAVPFTDRQKYLIAYSPVDAAGATELRSEMCKSRGLLPYKSEYSTIVSDPTAGCFIPYPETPAYVPRMQGSASNPRPRQRAPVEIVAPYEPPSASPLATLCGSSPCGPAPVPPPTASEPSRSTSSASRICPQTIFPIRGKTVNVVSPPKNTATSHRILTYRMGAPTGDCPIVGGMTADGQTTSTTFLESLYNKIRPTLQGDVADQFAGAGRLAPR